MGHKCPDRRELLGLSVALCERRPGCLRPHIPRTRVLKKRIPGKKIKKKKKIDNKRKNWVGGMAFLRDARVPETARGGRFEMRQEFLIVSSLPLRLDPIDHDSLLAAEGHQQSACSDGPILRCLARRFDISFLY